MNHSLDYLRRQAKSLKRAFAAGDDAAIARARAVLPDAAALKHADALHVIAREQGHQSWPKLKSASEIAAMDRDARAERLKYALYLGQHWVVDTLLAADPDLPKANLGLQIALYDRAAVEAALASGAEAATRSIGVRSPLLHLAFSKRIHAAPEKRGDMIAIAEALVAAGADVNDSYPAGPDSPHRLSALYGALGHADNMALATWLLEKGADPNDNESLYHSTELGHHDGLKLLLKHGAVSAGTNALPRAMDFDDVEAVRLLLDAGADPNEGVAQHPSGLPNIVIPGLHQAARRMCSAEMAELLIARGADGRPPYNGHTAYAFARMRGNRAVASVLERAGQATELDETEALLAAAADGAASGRVDPDKLDDETRRIMTRVLGFPGVLAHIQRLHAIGIDPEWKEEMGLTSAHVAGWEGHAPELEWLLTLDPDLEHVNDYGGNLLDTVLHGAENCPARARRDHLACVKLVLAKGATLRRANIVSAGDEEIAAALVDWAEAHPDRLIEDVS